MSLPFSFWGAAMRGICLVVLLALSAAAPIPRYDHVFVMIEENQGFDRIIGNPSAPHLNRLAQDYGLATSYYGAVHPSEGNYVAMLGGDTFGIHDDDPPSIHTIEAPCLADQVIKAGLSWKGYFEDLPAPGSDVVVSPRADFPLYAVKHNGFMNFSGVQRAPDRARHIVDFAELFRDIDAGALPAFAHIVPNQCNDMHGLKPGPDTPEDCYSGNLQGRIARGDRTADELVRRIMGSAIWKSAKNVAIVITWDEDEAPKSPQGTQGCCGYEPGSPANFGGGRVATIVIANHGPRAFRDPTPYNHYSLLRTIEDALGISEHLRHAAEVEPMSALFQVGR